MTKKGKTKNDVMITNIPLPEIAITEFLKMISSDVKLIKLQYAKFNYDIGKYSNIPGSTFEENKKSIMHYYNNDALNIEIYKSTHNVLELNDLTSPLIFFDKFYAFGNLGATVSVLDSVFANEDVFSNHLSNMSKQVSGVVNVLETIIETKKMYSERDRFKLVKSLKLTHGSNCIDYLLRTAPDYLSPFIGGFKYVDISKRI